MAVRITPVFGFADAVLDYFNSGAGPIDDTPYGGRFPGTVGVDFPIPVPLTAALGDDGATQDFVSLPDGSFIVLGFRDEVIVDGPGDDIFVTEVSDNSEAASVLVSSDGRTFVDLGTAGGGEVASFDLADIGFTGAVTAVKVIGLDVAGGSPGFDLVNVRAVGEAGEDLSGDNDLTGTDARDRISLGAGRDRFEAGAGNDRVSGGGGRDRLFGEGGRDALLGGAGADVLDGGAGRDRMTGGRGADRFVISDGTGRDVVTDFGGRDRIDFRDSFAVGGFDDLRGRLEDTARGVVFFLGDDQLLLQDVLADDLNRGDFLF